MTELCTIIKSAICRTRVGKPRPAPTLFMYPGLSSSPIYQWNDAQQQQQQQQHQYHQPFQTLFKDCSVKLQANLDVMLKEYEAIRQSTNGQSDYALGGDEHKLHQGGWDWNSYILKGKRQTEFAVRCPKTVEVLESFRDETELMTQTPFSFAFFSTLKSGTTSAPHYGPW